MESDLPPAEATGTTSGGERALKLTDLLGAFRRRWMLSLGILVATLAFVLSLTIALSPQFESEASVHVGIERSGGSGLGVISSLAEALPSDLGVSIPGEIDVATEIGLIRSRRILAAVAMELGLHVELLRPWRAFRTEVLRVIHADETAPEGVFTLTREEDDRYSVSAEDLEKTVILPEGIGTGTPFSIGSLALEIRPVPPDSLPPTIRFRVHPFRRVIQKLRRDLEVQREDPGSRLVSLRYRHPDPHLAQRLVNGVLDEFLAYSEDVDQGDRGRRLETLTEETERYGALLARAERELQRFQEDQQIIHTEEQAIQQVRRMAEVSVQRDALIVERDALARFLDDVSAGEPAETADRLETPYRRLATFPSFLANAAVQDFLSTLTELENARSELLVRRTESNLDVVRIQSRIQELERELHSLAVDYQGALETQILSTEAILEEMGEEMEAIPAVELEYARRSRERRLYSEVYLTLQARLAEAQVEAAMENLRARVVDRGTLSDRPAFPRLDINLALGSLLGLLLAIFGVVLVETTRPVLRSTRDARAQTGVDVLGVVPALHRWWDFRSSPLLLWRQPGHVAAEGFRSLAAVILEDKRPPGIILVTSPDRREGRTTVALNLAAALAEQGPRTALVDGDLRNGSLEKVLSMGKGHGWVAAASTRQLEEPDEARPEPVVDVGTGFDFFPAGPSESHPLSILPSEGVRSFLRWLSREYEAVVIDTPSLGEARDATFLARFADVVILVSQLGRTTKDDLREAVAVLSQATDARPALILTDVPTGA